MFPDVDVQVRTVDLTVGNDDVAAAARSLTAAELARARRGTPAVYRRRVLLRAALRSALAERLGLEPSAVPLRITAAGRPEPVVTGDARALDVSCSASEGLGVVAVADGCRVGVDVQRVVPWSAEVLDEGWLARDEQLGLMALDPADRAVAVARCWSQKEAVLKAAGVGLAGGPAATRTTPGRAECVIAGWRVRDVPVRAGWVCSLAVRTPEEVLP